MKLLNRLAPGFAARRAENRVRLQRAEGALAVEKRRAEIVQSYDAARTGGRFSGWARSQTSASTEIQSALPFLRATSRDLVRNSPHANRAMRVIQTQVAGTGVRPRAELAGLEGDARKRLLGQSRDQWERFVDHCDPTGQLDFYGQQRLLMRTVAEGGEALRIWTPRALGNRLVWRCEVVEGDLLDHTKNESLAGGGRIVQGVEFDVTGARVAYWLHEYHPGDRYMPGGFQFDLRRVPAQFVDHAFEVLRPGQVRGIPWIAPSAMILRDVEDLAEAEVVRKKLEACISMVVHNSHDDTDTGGSLNPATDDAGTALRTSGGNPIDRMEPGMIMEARPGWGVEFNAPPASEGLVEHMKERLHAIAAGIGTTYTQLTGDMTEANYSSMRAGQIDFDRLVDTWQGDLMIQQTGKPAWRRVMRAAQISGDFSARRVPRATWTPPARPWVDPEKDVRAARAEMEAGLRSPQQLIARTGRAPEDVAEELREWIALTAGLTLEPSLGGGGEKPGGGDETKGGA